MPIRINLLAEAQAAEELRRKDPVKRATYVAGFLVFLVALWATTLQFKIMTAKGELSALDTKWRDIEKNYKAAVESRRAAREADEKLSALQHMSTNRFLWGNALNALQFSFDGLEGIRVSHLRTDQSYLVNEGTPGRTNGSQVIPGKSTTMTERIKLIIDGTDATAGSRVQNFKKSIASVPYFKANLKQTDGVVLKEQGPPMQSSPDAPPVVIFTFECYFPNQTR